MKTMYKAERQFTKDFGGYGWETIGAFQTTVEDARILVADTPKGWVLTGNYRVIAVTMDEATFTYTEEIVIDYNYFKDKELGAWLENTIRATKNTVADYEKNFKRIKTEDFKARRLKEIADCKAKIEKWEKELAEWKARG